MDFTARLDFLTRRLSLHAHARDVDEAWPVEALDALREAGAFGFVIRRDAGGMELSAAEQVLAYESVARGSMAAALILTQHDAACQLIAGGESAQLAAQLIPRMAGGELLATVGISQLTTSRRGGEPAMRAMPDGAGFRLTGVMPWVTSAPHCDWIVTGGVLDGGLQILAATPRHRDGLVVDPPMHVVALRAAATSEVHCRDVRVEPDEVLQPPSKQALARRAPVKSLTVSACGIGLARAMLDAIDASPSRCVADFDPLVRNVQVEFDRVRANLLDAAARRQDPAAEVPAEAIRADVNALLHRLSAFLLTVAKGSGLRVGHAAQRLAREAMFFLVWSAPDTVRAATLERLVHSGPRT